MTALTFTIPGPARGKGRPRATVRGGHAAVYTDDKTVAYENLVKMVGRAALGQREPFRVPIRMEIVIWVAPPASVSRKRRLAMLLDEEVPAKKPDISNIIKAVEDGLNGVVFTDDALIVHLTAFKAYSETAQVRVSIAEWFLPDRET